MGTQSTMLDVVKVFDARLSRHKDGKWELLTLDRSAGLTMTIGSSLGLRSKFDSYLEHLEQTKESALFYYAGNLESDTDELPRTVEFLWEINGNGRNGIGPIKVQVCSKFPGINLKESMLFIADDDALPIDYCNLRFPENLADADSRLCSSKLHSHLTFKICPGALWKSLQACKNSVQIINGIPLFRFVFGSRVGTLTYSAIAQKSQLDDMKKYLEQLPKDFTLNGVPCHKFVLMSRSEVFNRMLQDGMLENDRNEVTIKIPSFKRPVSREAIEFLLKFLYYSDAEELVTKNMKIVQELIHIAHQYDIQALLHVCTIAIREDETGHALNMYMHMLLGLYEFAMNAGLEHLKLTLVDIFIKAKNRNLSVIDECIEISESVTARLLGEGLRDRTLDFSPTLLPDQKFYSYIVDQDEDDW